MKPALTKDEWRDMTVESMYGVRDTDLHVDHKGRIFVTGYGEDELIVILNEERDAPRVLHAVAALCLYGQPFGFTWEDVVRLRDASRYLAEVWKDVIHTFPLTEPPDFRIGQIADRIEALLPPDAGCPT